MPVPEYSITPQNASEKQITESGERIRVIYRYARYIGRRVPAQSATQPRRSLGRFW
jgi:hypothetical protein